MGDDRPIEHLGGGLHHNIQAFGDLAQGNLGGAGSEVGQAFNDWGQATGLVKKPTSMDPSAPPAPPTLGQANQVTLQAQLSHEQRQAAASTILTGGGGLLDQPTTASQVLLGS